MELVSVAALTPDGVIGRGDGVPWEAIPADRAQYLARVESTPVIVGRRTFDSMRGDPPGCAQVVLSRRLEVVDVETATVAASVDEAIATAKSFEEETAYVVGGGTVYEQFLPHVDRMVLSRLRRRYDGDCYYPNFDRREWTLDSTVDFERFVLEEWRRL